MWLFNPSLPRRKTCRWSRKSQMPFYPRTDTSLMWFLSTMMWMRAWRAWRKPWSEPPPPHSGCLCPGCTDTRLAQPSLCLLKGSAISVFKMKKVMGVLSVYGVYVWFKSLRYFAHMHPKNISNMLRFFLENGEPHFFFFCGCLENCASGFFGYTRYQCHTFCDRQIVRKYRIGPQLWIQKKIFKMREFHSVKHNIWFPYF